MNWKITTTKLHMVPIIAWPILKNPVKIPRNESPRICKCDLSFSQKGNLSSTGSPHILKWTTISTVNCWRHISSVYVKQSPLAYPGIRAALKMAFTLASSTILGFHLFQQFTFRGAMLWSPSLWMVALLAAGNPPLPKTMRMNCWQNCLCWPEKMHIMCPIARKS